MTRTLNEKAQTVITRNQVIDTILGLYNYRADVMAGLMAGKKVSILAEGAYLTATVTNVTSMATRTTFTKDVNVGLDVAYTQKFNLDSMLNMSETHVPEHESIPELIRQAEQSTIIKSIDSDISDLNDALTEFVRPEN